LKSAWPIYAVAGLNAGVFAFDGPARQSLIPRLVPRDRLANAVSLNSLSSQVASIVGPALLGPVIGLGLGWVYCLNAASFLAVIGALLLMDRNLDVPTTGRSRVSLEAAFEGLRFIRGHRLLISLMLLDFLATFFSSATTLLPVYARDLLKIGPAGYGQLSAAPAVGSLLAAGALALMPPIRRQGVVVLWSVFAYGVSTIVFGVSGTFLACFLALAGTGVADTVSTVLRQTIRQLVTPNHLRGRMTSINMMFFMGGPQLGELEAGSLAALIGAPFSVVVGGVGALICAALAAVKSKSLMEFEI
jgi:hypothetical protein